MLYIPPALFFVVLFCLLEFFKGNGNALFVCLGICFFFSYPLIGIFLRVKTVFNNESSEIVIDGEVTYDIGYIPFAYQVISVLIGVVIFYNEYKFITLHSLSGWTLISHLLICLLGIFILQTLVLFPDKFNKVLPMELRSTEGCIFFLGGIVLLASLFAYSLFSFNVSIIILRFLRWPIFWGCVLGVIILYGEVGRNSFKRLNNFF